MSKRMRWGLGVVAAFVVAGITQANDSNLKAELADLKAKVAAMEASQMAPAAGGDSESLTSMKKKGAIKIGGNTDIALIVQDRDENPTQFNGEDDEIQSTQFCSGDTDLDFDIAASKDMGLFIKLDLDDAWNENTDQDDLLEECYFYWKHVGGSNWQLNFGKKEVPFGMDKKVGYFYPYTHAQSTCRTSLFRASEEVDADWNDADGNTDRAENDPLNEHSTVGLAAAWAGEVDNVFQVESIFTYKDLMKLYMSVFQSNQTTGGGRNTRGMHEDRSDDTMLFQSYATKLEVTPLEGLYMQLSFMTQNIDSYGENDHNNYAPLMSAVDGEENTHAISFGIDYKFKSVPVNLFGEYIHNWDMAFDDRMDADVFSVGIVWGVTENIDLGFMVDYADVDGDDNEIVDAGQQDWLYEDQDFWSIDLALTYKFDNGISATLEYKHEWFDGDRAGNLADLDADADAIAFVMSWSF